MPGLDKNTHALQLRNKCAQIIRVIKLVILDANDISDHQFWRKTMLDEIAMFDENEEAHSFKSN